LERQRNISLLVFFVVFTSDLHMEITGAADSCSSRTMHEPVSSFNFQKMDAMHTISLTFGAPSCGKKKLITGSFFLFEVSQIR
jgi:hypothetical protein